MTKLLTLSGQLTNDMGCVNCAHKHELEILPYRHGIEEPICAVIVLCSLCRMAHDHKELGIMVETRVTGQQGPVDQVIN